EYARVAVGGPDIGDVMMGRDLVVVGQRRGVAQRHQGRAGLLGEPQGQIQLLPEVPAVPADAAYVQLFGALVQTYVVWRNEDQVIAQISELQTDLFSEALYATYFLGQEASVDHNHPKFLFSKRCSRNDSHCQAWSELERTCRG